MPQTSQSVSLTAADFKLLKLLQSDASATRQELADAAGMSLSTLWRRMSELEEIGAIHKRVVLLDPAGVGLPVCVLVSVNVAAHDRDTRTRFEDFVSDTPDIVESYSVTGTYDYMLIIRARDIAAFEEFLMNRILGHPSVASAYSQIALRQTKYSTELPL